MPGHIYLLKDDALIQMEETPYPLEKHLQEYLAKHHDLLAGDQIDSVNARRWLLVAREMSIPDQNDGSGRWSLDHLFLDQDAVPTLVEVKRSSDPRIRREVVGQMLDYAANALAYWPVERVRMEFEGRCKAEGKGPEEALLTFLEGEQDPDEFWGKLKKNLDAGCVRLIFLADAIPPELRRVVEFLNQQMDPAEVLAVEVKHFKGPDNSAFVPRLLGQTEKARLKKSGGSGSRREECSEADFVESFKAINTADDLKIVHQLIAWARVKGLEDAFLDGKRGLVFQPRLRHGSSDCRFFTVKEDGRISFPMKNLKHRPPFDNEIKRAELHQKICAIPGFEMQDAGMEGFPSIPIASLSDDTQLGRLMDALDWMVSEIRATV